MSTVYQWRQSKFILVGAKFFRHMEGDEASAEGWKPEARRAESRGGVLGEGAASPLPTS